MAEERIIQRLQTPADLNGERQDIDVITSAEAVIYNENKTLKEKMEELANMVTISNTKPGYPCIWILPTSIESAD